jgi:Na+-transporting NADH:ubiquinone oxidoreductase subunit B
MSFGAIVGQHIFGGSGRYIVSPALLGVLFVHFSYPTFSQLALPFDSAFKPDWHQVVASGIGQEAWLPHLLGTAPGAIASGSALACVAGAVALVAARVASWRVIAGGVIGLFAASLIVGWSASGPVADLPWYWHLVLGNFAFALVFIATDPSAAPVTRPARWLFGGAIGMLTVLIRTLDPAHPEGTLFAVLLAALALPLMDHLALSRHRVAGGQP